MSGRLRRENGQAVLMTVVFLVVLLGGAAMAVDVGSWYRQQRQAQAAADAGALAGAQALPTDTGQALALAQTYASSNGGVSPSSVTFSSSFLPNDTVNVKVMRTAPGFFSRIFSIASVTVSAQASARASTPSEAFGVAPIVVNKLHPLLSGPGCPCFGTQTQLPLGKTGAPGAFGMVDLEPSGNGNVGASTLADWVENGYPGYLPLGPYDSDPGAKFNSSGIQSALTSRLNGELLFPVYTTLTGNGSNAHYEVVAWVGFYLEAFESQGNSGSLTGHFTRVIWNGIQGATNPNIPNFGAYSIALVK